MIQSAKRPAWLVREPTAVTSNPVRIEDLYAEVYGGITGEYDSWHAPTEAGAKRKAALRLLHLRAAAREAIEAGGLTGQDDAIEQARRNLRIAEQGLSAMNVDEGEADEILNDVRAAL